MQGEQGALPGLQAAISSTQTAFPLALHHLLLASHPKSVGEKGSVHPVRPPPSPEEVFKNDATNVAKGLVLE